MKHPLLIVLLLLAHHAFAQESALDYIVPSVRSEKTLYKINGNSLTGDITKLEHKNGMIRYAVNSSVKEDGSVSYKIIYFDEPYGDIEDHAFFVKFSGNNAALDAYSEYVQNDDNIFEIFVTNENYYPSTGYNFIKVPVESYQTLEWSFVNPATFKTVEATSYYKNMTFAGQDRRLLVIEYKENDKVSKEYFVKNFGLVARQLNNGDIYVVDFSNFNLYDQSFINSKSEEDLRIMAWDIIERMIKVKNDDSFYMYGNPNKEEMMIKYDSVNALYENMILKNPGMLNAYRYIMCVYNKYVCDMVFTSSEKNDMISYNYYDLMEMINNYYLYRPYPEYISKYGLSTYVTGVEENYYQQFWKMQYEVIKSIRSCDDFETDYKLYLMKPYVDAVIRGSSTIDNSDQCILYSYVSSYYYLKGDNVLRYHYMAKFLEKYTYLSQADKDLNIEFMRNVMKSLQTLVPGNEADLNDVLSSVIGLKDYGNAVKIADNGYRNGVGQSLEFAFKYAEAAYNDELNKEHLRIAMKMMDGKFEQMTLTQLEDYVRYCQAMKPEFNCSKVQSMAEKKRKKEAKSNAGSSSSGRSRSSYDRKVNLAVMANPFAGLNISGKGGTFKFLPMSATLRLGSTVHEFRYNPFFGFDAKNRFVGGKIGGSEINTNAGWKNLKGADYGYSLIFVKNDRSYSGKNCSSIGGGLNVIYGSFTADPETLQATVYGKPQILTLNPKITRYEGLISISMNYFDWKSHVSACMYYGFGAGVRQIDYGNKTFSQDELSDSEKTKFQDKRYDQANWNGAYLSFRMGFRFGFTLF